MAELQECVLWVIWSKSSFFDSMKYCVSEVSYHCCNLSSYLYTVLASSCGCVGVLLYGGQSK
jgi:hypothetical protein